MCLLTCTERLVSIHSSYSTRASRLTSKQAHKLADMYREQVIQLEDTLARIREEGEVGKDLFKVRGNGRSARICSRYGGRGVSERICSRYGGG